MKCGIDFLLKIVTLVCIITAVNFHTCSAALLSINYANNYNQTPVEVEIITEINKCTPKIDATFNSVPIKK